MHHIYNIYFFQKKKPVVLQTPQKKKKKGLLSTKLQISPWMIKEWQKKMYPNKNHLIRWGEVCGNGIDTDDWKLGKKKKGKVQNDLAVILSICNNLICIMFIAG